jgi:hypothetical protein
LGGGRREEEEEGRWEMEGREGGVVGWWRGGWIVEGGGWKDVGGGRREEGKEREVVTYSIVRGHLEDREESSESLPTACSPLFRDP